MDHDRPPVVAAFAYPLVDGHLTEERHPGAGGDGQGVSYGLPAAGSEQLQARAVR